METKAEILFPNLLWKSEIKTDVDSFARQILSAKDNDKGVDISNAGGWQSKPQDISKTNIQFLIDLDKSVKNICTQAGLPALRLYNLWFNVNPPFSYNTIHNHHGAVLSGAYYIQVPEDSGNIEFYRDDQSEYYIPQLESYNSFTSQKKVLTPVEQQLLVFPGWLRHSVSQNKSSKERISLSFNYGVR